MSTEIDYENMSDEDFAKLDGADVPLPEDDVDVPLPEDDVDVPDTVEDRLDGEAADPVRAEGEEDPAPAGENGTADTDADDVTSNPEGGESAENGHTKADQSKAKGSEKDPSPADPEEGGEPAASAEGDGTGEGEGDPDPKAETPQAKEEEAPSIEDAYKKIMAPFKANGREFTPKDPDEVVRLMQMGANYAKKMQALRPNLRMMKMLENNDLLDEGKLNYLIDLNARNPEAIKKLLHDSKIDPLDLDTSEMPEYTPGNHSVSEQQYAFQETVTDLKSTSGGQETLQTVHQQWDQASKEELFKDPKILNLIHEQRENGIYGRITDELERQKLLGNFEDLPFIHAYKAVGDYLHERGELIPASETPATPDSTAVQNTPRELVETRTATPKAKLANGDRVAGTAPPRSTPAAAKKSFDPFSMSDEEIMRMSLPNS